MAMAMQFLLSYNTYFQDFDVWEARVDILF